MLLSFSNLFSKIRKFIPMLSTAFLALAAYGVGAYFFVGMRNPQVFFNLFKNTSYLLISSIGMTLVILTGGIDLSVSGVVALTSVSSAVLLRDGMNPWVVILLMLAMGMTLGFIMGNFIVRLKVQPFIATLAGMWFARGMCFFISDNAVQIDHPFFTILGQTKILIPGLKELADRQGTQPPYVTIPVVVGFILLMVMIYILANTRFGRSVYAIGGNEGRNEQSARLMGLPVDRVKLIVYTFNGFCSAVAGIAFAVFVQSGHGLYAPGMELEAIASVVMGGTMLSGGAGYVIGTFFGVLVLAVTQALIQFIGSLSSWWTRIVIGALTLVFIGVQSVLANRKGSRALTPQELKIVRQRRLKLSLGVGAVAVLLVSAVVLLSKYAPTKSAGCTVPEFRKEEAASLIKDGALIAYQRIAGPRCVDQMYAIYPDGQVTGTDGKNNVKKQVTPAEVEQLLTVITVDHKWFTPEIFDTYLTPCGQCFAHYILVSYKGQEKGATGTDGTTAIPPDFLFALAQIRPFLPEITAP